jgi:hypothetical protein
MHELQTIPEGRAGLQVKLAKIRQLIEDAKRSPAFRRRALAIVSDLPERDHFGEVCRVHEFVARGVRFVRDPWSPGGLELFIAPAVMLADVERGTAAGDCDDHVILAAALLETLGYRTRFRVGGLPPDHYRHIWLEASTPNGWVPMELTKKDAPCGFDPSPRFPLTLTADGTEDDMNTRKGLGAPIVSAAAARQEAKAAARQLQLRLRQQRQAAAGVQRDSGRRFTMPLPSATKAAMQEASRMSAYGQKSQSDVDRLMRARAIRERSRGGRLPSRQLGDYELPPSMHNLTPQEERWRGVVPSDLWRDAELAEEQLGGLGSKLKKLRKKVTSKAKKVTKTVAKAVAKAPKNALRPFKMQRDLFKGIGRGVQDLAKGVKAMATGALQAPAAYTGGDGELVQPDPYEPLAPMPIVDYYGGGGGMPAFEATPDPWAGWDATYEGQEVQSLYTPATAEWIGPDAPMPGQGAGSYEETYDWPDTYDAFAQPAYGDQGMDYPAMDAEHEIDVYDDPYGELGDLTWLENLAQQVGSTVLTYQQAKLQAKAASKGYAPLSFGATIPASAPVATPPPVLVMQQEPPPAPPAMPKLPNWMPWALGSVALVTLAALMGGTRRSRR